MMVGLLPAKRLSEGIVLGDIREKLPSGLFAGAPLIVTSLSPADAVDFCDVKWSGNEVK